MFVWTLVAVAARHAKGDVWEVTERSDLASTLPPLPPPSLLLPPPSSPPQPDDDPALRCRGLLASMDKNKGSHQQAELALEFTTFGCAEHMLEGSSSGRAQTLVAEHTQSAHHLRADDEGAPCRELLRRMDEPGASTRLSLEEQFANLRCGKRMLADKGTRIELVG
jgi:hypothetical protein